MELLLNTGKKQKLIKDLFQHFLDTKVLISSHSLQTSEAYPCETSQHPVFYLKLELDIRDARGSLFSLWGRSGRDRGKNVGVGRGGEGRNSSGRGGVKVKLGAFSGWGGAGQF